ncbi:glycoside hydrolase family 95 protein [Aplosporella prunicola CBS 121167]|uniref:Glycoside hydrolase family 95 protein n=1 Tax=Aplosporella prunicola CBS 121167 TaxID=1176127 RepID=A0A6A6B4Y5_9PEZI|nr:glycoside hydrolase family 95 protein [Aplosporella prunicola CBS 121167]KAF2138264.1 glycoside hydrolase family 95 protein [Aplosporella prunicola CBS 121167]
MRLFVAVGFVVAGAAQAKVLWASTPAEATDVMRQAYPVGNGFLGALPFGAAGKEKVSLNVDSLWSGGPFAASNYTGGNPNTTKYQYLPEIRDTIFRNGAGHVYQLLGDASNYGSFRVLGNLSIAIDGVTSTTAYNRSLDLDTGIHSTSFQANGNTSYTTTIYCSYPDKVCVYRLSSSDRLPTVTVSFENTLAAPELQNPTCGDGFVRLAGVTQLGPPEGMRYDAFAQVVDSHIPLIHCSNTTTGALVIPSSANTTSIELLIAAGTNYDQKKGTREHNFSFKGEDPEPRLRRLISAASKKHKTLLSRHLEDFQSLTHAFSLDLPDTLGSAGLETATLITRYNTTAEGDPYVDSLLFDYARYLLISSARERTLPANLAGKWLETLEGAWADDYHLDINVQMNYWHADQTGLGRLQQGLWDYIEDTIVPRGEETAALLYGAPGWLVHGEVNIFGHTGMKDVEKWADYQAAPAWLMQHVWDHYTYTQNSTWFAAQGYPLLKGVARFWLSQLRPDALTNDSTLVALPCTSPEHGPVTFGCAHYQQLIHQVLHATASASALGHEPDAHFTQAVHTALAALDKGVHVSPQTGALQEWKLPSLESSPDIDPHHRHLSHLTGWHPGHSIASLAQGYSAAPLQAAVRAALLARGNGTAPDADAGWAKLWRAAAWARLNDTAAADALLRYAVGRNFAPNGFSMYSAADPPFQIDANFGLAGAVLSMLVVDLPAAELGRAGGTGTVVLGPAIPGRWAGGSVRGLRLRGGGSVAFTWDAEGVVTEARVEGRSKRLTVVNKRGDVLVEV